MRALLVQAATPISYWGYQHSLPFIRKGATLPPLGLATLAAHLPERWELRLRDLHLAPLDDADLRWADAVLVSGMLVQAGSLREVLVRAREAGKVTVVGGPAATTSPDAFPEATFVFRGEAEGRLDRLIQALERPGSVTDRVVSPPGLDRPDLSLARVPRFDLCALDRYATFAIQVSRGCPFSCEFCDVIEIFGRAPRVKAPAQVLAELEALRRLGARGPLFLVDDNFIGNRRAVAAILPEIARWQREHLSPFDLYTEASLDLATEPALLASMVDAGFSAVFVGIETPNPASLAEAGKKQNLRVDPAEAVRVLTRAGLEVFAGFIVGFDGDGPDIFDRQLAFISSLPIPRAMVGILTALPGTALWRRLERERRLRGAAVGDQFGRPNFAPAMGERTLVAGYRRLLAGLFTADAYFRRCARHLEEAPMAPTPLRPGGLATFLRAVWRLGVVGSRRGHFWRLLGTGLRRAGLLSVPKAVTLAILGEHLIRYTEEEVLPRLDRALATAPSAR
ncbi:MAG TPA: B12-binding domain-containing radical SAM protein [Anaeromyxobacteraceae bacterium]|nr:B12-binding domain-containing radical SAM protein [Anaeromyxobacteraceae bacterium]